MQSNHFYRTNCPACSKQVAQNTDGTPRKHKCVDPKEDFNQFALRINPATLGFSPKMVAIVGAIIGYDYQVRNFLKLTAIHITSDGFVIGSTDPISSGAFLGDYVDLFKNLSLLSDELTLTDNKRFCELYNQRVTDYRTNK